MVFPEPVCPSSTWTGELVHRVAEAVSIELPAIQYNSPPVAGTGTNNLRARTPW
jgi:hypothetical protein